MVTLVDLLLIEDDTAVAAFIQEVLEMFFSANVLIAPSASHARQIWAQHKDTVSLILSDLVLPGEPGEKVVAELVATDRNVPVIFITGHLRDAGQLSRAVQKPVTLLLKPFKPADLKAAVEYALATVATPAA